MLFPNSKLTKIPEIKVPLRSTRVISKILNSDASSSNREGRDKEGCLVFKTLRDFSWIKTVIACNAENTKLLYESIAINMCTLKFRLSFKLSSGGGKKKGNISEIAEKKKTDLATDGIIPLKKASIKMKIEASHNIQVKAVVKPKNNISLLNQGIVKIRPCNNKTILTKKINAKNLLFFLSKKRKELIKR